MLAALVLLALAAPKAAADVFVSPFTGGQPVDVGISNPTARDFAYTCDPAAAGQPGGQVREGHK